MRVVSAWMMFPALVVLANPVAAATVRQVPADYARITDALAACAVGDTVRVAAGTYSAAANGEAFPLSLTTAGVVLQGAGSGLSLLDAGGTGSVVRCAATGVRVTGWSLSGGRADAGGGVYVESGSAEIDHLLVTGNQARLRGSAIAVDAAATPWVHHNVLWGNSDSEPQGYGDPHAVQLTGCDGLVEQNTIGLHDSNGLITEAGSEAEVRNNILYQNGSVALNRGRGICALGGSGQHVHHNLFYGNVISAMVILTPQGALNATAAVVDAYDPIDGLHDNLDGDPQFEAPGLGDVRLVAGSPAIDAGDPTSPYDPDGTRADIGALFHDQATVGICCPFVGGWSSACRAFPNPVVRGASAALAFELALPTRVTVGVFDARGAFVRHLFEGPLGAGPQRFAWDGRDGSGRRVASGVYFARVATDAGAAVTRLVFLD